MAAAMVIFAAIFAFGRAFAIELYFQSAKRSEIQFNPFHYPLPAIHDPRFLFVPRGHAALLFLAASAALFPASRPKMAPLVSPVEPG